ncbi:MAG: hypothetical protein KQH57_16285 [Actinomycetales bacterium]|nr:hypothetical protein [Actinomycetales bacterium]
MTTMLLDRVAAYAEAVRSHLADLGPEIADELTDGLEADLAEELADRSIDGAETADDTVLLDLARVFGPAGEYALELRSAAGHAPVPSARRLRRTPVRDAARSTWRLWEAWGRRLVARVAALPGGGWLVETVPLLRPVWWLVRGWVWFVLLMVLTGGTLGAGRLAPFAPDSFVAWALLIAAAVVSIEHGRGRWAERRRIGGLLVAGQALAVLAVVPLAAAAWTSATQAHYYPVYASAGSDPVAAPQDGVVVGGMYVSNLFVYDAQGNPLHDVQIVDDRGRPVRTVTDGSDSVWSLPGVADPWQFAPVVDASGRDRWNVYPLSGAPAGEWTWDAASGAPVLVPGASLQQPPAPFGAAEALVGTGVGGSVAAAPPGGADGTVPDAPSATGSQAASEAPATPSEPTAPSGAPAQSPSPSGP